MQDINNSKGWEFRLSATLKGHDMNTDKRINFLVNEIIQFIWSLRKADDKSSLEEFRERLADTVVFADIELHELEIKNKITTLLVSDINKDTADEISELVKDIRRFVSEQERKSA